MLEDIMIVACVLVVLALCAGLARVLAHGHGCDDDW